MLMEYLSCITIMIGIGLESLLISNAVEIVIQNIDSDSMLVREATIYVLDEVCNVFYSGQGYVAKTVKLFSKRTYRLVIDALTKISKEESKKFLPLVSPLKDTAVPISMKVYYSLYSVYNYLKPLY